LWVAHIVRHHTQMFSPCEPHHLELLEAMKKCLHSLERSDAVNDPITNDLLEALRKRIAEIELHAFN